MAAFSPLLGSSPHTLILGSMPGKVSLDQRQYYAHPRNAFWSIMQALYDVDAGLLYQDRTVALTNQQICVWDVLHDCERKGSLDSNIVLNTSEPNDFSGFFEKNESIRIVGFNGLAARRIFNCHCRALYEEFTNIEWVDLPSSSPAYAAMTLETKIQVWKSKLHSVR